MLQSLRKNKVVKNAGWIIGGKVANKLLAFVVGIFAARYLGPSNYGLINYAAAYATFFASLCTLGINSVIVKNFVDHPDQQGETIGTTLLLRAMSSLLSALAIIGIVSVVDVSLFVSAMICLVAKPFILILYGKTYLPAVGPLRIVVWYTAFSYLGVARNAWMVCENRQKYLKYLYISAAALNVVLNFALIPSWGASGAAAASLITQASTTILLPALIRPLRPNTKLMLDAVLLRGVLPEKQRNHTKE